MHSLMNYMLKLLIIICAIDHSICKPIVMEGRPSMETNAMSRELALQNDQFRSQRQVVQPTWLQGKTDNRSPLRKQGVRVTDQNLKETAEIRALIQDAVDNDKFAVKTDQMQPSITPENSDDNDVPIPWSFKLPADWNAFQFFGSSDQQQVEFVSFWDEVQRMWSDITENYIQHIIKEFNWFQQS